MSRPRAVLRVAVVDDEPPARGRIELLLAREPDVEVVSSCATAAAAIQHILEDTPNLVFLDVQMPEHNGFDVVHAVGVNRMPLTVFVTAYDRYAVEAFDAAAIDYLLKPFSDERFAEALNRARVRLKERDLSGFAERVASLVGSSHSTPACEPTHLRPDHRDKGYAERIAVSVGGRSIIVPVHAIDYITSEGPYAELHTAGKTYVVRQQMKRLEQALSPEQFCRIHRTTIVKLNRVASLEPLFRGDYEVRLVDGTRLRLSRTWREEFTRRLGIAVP